MATITHGITLGSGGYTSPLTIGAGDLLSVSGGPAIYASYDATVVNAGGSITSNNFGVQLNAGGSIVNAGSIYGGGGVLRLQGGTDSFTNQTTGILFSRYGYGFFGTAAAAATVVNEGTIGLGQNLGGVSQQANNSGVVLRDSGDDVISNAASGLITSGYNFGVYVTGASSATVTNAGIIGHAAGIGHSNGDGVRLVNSGANTIVNQAGGFITSTYNNDIFVSGASTATIINAGVIGHTPGVGHSNGDGVSLTDNSSAILINQTGGIISSSYNHGVLATGTASVTVMNAGTITGSSDAVKFGTGTANRLVVDPGAVFIGLVDAGTTIGSTLELASGASTGTLTGLGSQFVNFADLTIDPAADWSFNGTNYLNPGATITNAGTLMISGGLTVASTLINDGTLIGAAGLQFASGGTNRLVINPGAVFVGAVDGAAPGASTLELASATASGALTGLGSQYKNFGNIMIDVGATWSISGLVAAFGTTTITNLRSVDVLDLTDLPFAGSNTVTTIGNDLIIRDSTSTPLATVHLSSWLGVPSFSLQDDGHGGSILQNDIPPTIANGITIGSPGYLNPLTITTGERVSLASGTAVYASYAATVVNLGQITGASGVRLEAGGFVENAAGSTISGTGGTGIYSTGGSATVTNHGVVTGNIVALRFASNTANRLILDPVATFSGIVDGGPPGYSTLELASAVSEGTLHSLGTQFIGFSTITIASSATWTFVSNAIGAGYTIIDAGTLTNTGSLGSGVTLEPGAMLTNSATGTITGSGVLGGGGNTVVNQGQIAGSNGITLQSGGFVANAAGSASITGGMTAIYFAAGPGTVVNAGTIGGATAVQFAPGYADRLGIQPGAVFNGTVDGGNTAGSNAVSTLELGSSSSTGTLTGLGSAYVNFASLTIDSGASWTITGSVNGLNDTTITNLRSTDTLDLTDLPFTGAETITRAGNDLVISDVSANTLAVIHLSNLMNAQPFFLAGDGSGGTNIRNTLAATITQGITLGSGGYTSPLTISADDRLSVSGGPAIYASYDATVVNAGGSITSNNFGVQLNAGGSIVNAGSIYGGGGVLRLQGGTDSFTNQTTGVLFSRYGYGFFGTAAAAATVVNEGTIGLGQNLGGVSQQANNSGVVLRDSGDDVISNAASGLITSGYNFGVYVTGASSATVTNAGIIGHAAGIGHSNGDGVRLVNSGANTIVNQAGGFITSTYNNDIFVSGASTATIINAGVIGHTPGVGHSNGDGVSLTDNGSAILINQTGGIISSSYNHGVLATGTASVTVMNAGTITGSSDAVKFGTGTANRLVVDPGAVFIGLVDAGTTIGSTLELASGASTGTLTGLGSQFVNFADLTIDPAADWSFGGTNSVAGTSVANFGMLTLDDQTLTLSGILLNNGGVFLDPSSLTVDSLAGTGSVTIDVGSTFQITGTVDSTETIVFARAGGVLTTSDPLAMAGTIASFQTGDSIILDGITDATDISVLPGNTLVVTSSSLVMIDLAFDPTQNLSGATFHVNEVGGDAVVTAENLACFAAGTRLAGPSGLTAVEDIQPGDQLFTASGEVSIVRWVGYRQLDLRRHPAPERAQPIRIEADALADGIPRRPVRLSPDHAVLANGMLIPVRLLLNGTSIVRETTCRMVNYWHVELDTHDVLLAEGLPAESYLDTGNRGVFANADEALVLHPDLANDQVRRQRESCRPFADDAARVEPVWRALVARAAALGLGLPPVISVTDDPDLRLIAGDIVIRPSSCYGARYTFVLPHLIRPVRLVSRHAVPSTQRPWLEDRRRLGAMVSRLTLHCSEWVETIPLDHPLFRRGWWAVEHDGSKMWRWTDGDAELPFEATPPGKLVVELAGTLDYPLAPSLPVKRTRAIGDLMMAGQRTPSR